MRAMLRAPLLSAAASCAAAAPYPAYPLPAALPRHSVVADAASRGGVKLAAGRVSGAAAWGSYHDNITGTGTAILDVHSNGALPGEQQAFAAGYLEGALTSGLMWRHFNNVWPIDFDETTATLPNAPKREAAFVDDNLNWMKQNVRKAHGGDAKAAAYWQQVGFLLDQLDGMAAGFNAHLPHGAAELSSAQLLLITLIDGDMDDIIDALAAQQGRANALSAAAGLRTRRRRNHTHCSAMVQLAPDMRELWTAHTNWDDYQAMLRVNKYFDLPLPGAAAVRVSMDSYPGAMSSMTDFYRTSAGLTITETTLDVDNDALWGAVTPESVLTWARAMVANRLAGSADEWTEIDLRYQSGTNNNQWIAVDYKQFTPGKPLPPGTVWISETMPGYAERGDVTTVVNGDSRSWFSYNLPFFAVMQEKGGYIPPPDINDDFEHCPRARIHRRAVEARSVTDLASFVAFMRYDNITDPLALGDACNGISARCDLNPTSSRRFDCFGAIDIKVASASLPGLAFHAAMSPSWGDSNPPFQWSVQGKGCPDFHHAGQPDTYDFPMYTYPDVL